jgi:hypothetical protein
MTGPQDDGAVDLSGPSLSPRRRRVRHVIADIHDGEFDSPSWSECTCGERLHAASPDALADLWSAHGGRVSRSTALSIRPDYPRCPEPGCEAREGTCGLHNADILRSTRSLRGTTGGLTWARN